MKTKIKILIVAVVLVQSFVCTAQADLVGRINGIIRQPSLKKVRFSIRIVDANTGREVYSYNADTALIPASNMKVVVTAAAVKYLGANYEYKTKVGMNDNSLVVVGSGDPLLGDKKIDEKYNRKAGWIFEDIAAAMKKNNIATIGDIIVDSSVFDDQRVHANWPVEQLNNWYAAEVCGLNYDDNCIVMTVRNKGGRIEVIVEPSSSYIKITNKVMPISKGSGAVGAYRQAGKPNELVVKGKCQKAEGPFDVAIENPAEYFGRLVKENLAKAGITVQGQVLVKPTNIADARFNPLAEYTTSLTDCLTRANKNSLGLVAESLLKTISANANPDKKNGSWAGGREILSKYLLELGIPANEFNIDDGSGLSRENKLMQML